MHELYELKEKLMDALKEYSGKELSAGVLDVVDKLAHATKNLCKVIEECENEGSSERYYADGMSADGMSSRGMKYARDGGSYAREGGSYARGRMYAKRDSMGRYASDDDLTAKLHELMDTAPNERTRTEFAKFISKIEQM